MKMTLRIAKIEQPHRTGKMSVEKPVTVVSNGVCPPDPEPEVVGVPGLVREMIGRFSCQDCVRVSNGYSKPRCSPVRQNPKETSAFRVLSPTGNQDIGSYNAPTQDDRKSDHQDLRSLPNIRSDQLKTGNSKNAKPSESKSLENGEFNNIDLTRISSAQSTSVAVKADINLDALPPSSKSDGVLNSHNDRRNDSENVIENLSSVPNTRAETPNIKNTCYVSLSQSSSVLPTHGSRFHSIPTSAVTTETTCNDADVGIETSTEKDGNYFFGIVAKVESDLRSCCTELEQLLVGPIPDEGSGKIRAAIGKANLLITKKFKQFRELCNNNMNQSADDQFQTTAEDLSGFWDLVQLQVDDVQRLFKEIYALQANNWEVNKTEAITPSSSSSKVTDSKMTDQFITPTPKKVRSSKTSDSSKARDEARKRLMAAKMAGRQRKASETEEDIQIFI